MILHGLGCLDALAVLHGGFEAYLRFLCMS